jgi:hypothetical protein
LSRQRTSRTPASADPDPVAQAGMDSFPASDPPSWVPVHPGGPAPTAVKDPPASKTVDPPVDDVSDRELGEEQTQLDLPFPERAHRRPST